MYAWTVVIIPDLISAKSFNALAIGAKQFVVHEAALIILSVGFKISSFTPYTIVGKSSPAGAEIITFLAPALICAIDFSLDAKNPVHSNTTSTSNSFHGKLLGSASL